MSEDNLLRKIIRFFTAGKQASPPKPSAGNAEAMRNLLQMLEQTDEAEIPCDEVFALLDQYVEAELRGEDAVRLLPLVKKHLDRCQDCHEEYAALLTVIQSSAGSVS